MKLLSVNADYKTKKGVSIGYLTGILYLAPSTMVDGLNLCPFASEGCKKACLFSAGRGVMRPVKTGRVRKTLLWRDNRELFWSQLISDINAVKRKAARDGLNPVVRLNGTSDIRWESQRVKTGNIDAKNIMEIFPDVQFYDYTCDVKRLEKPLPNNYHLTFSRKESNDNDVKKAIELGFNVAVVFANMPKIWNNLPVISGDKNDLRFLDEKNSIVGLVAKGQAKKDSTGFVL